jgi:hypothetical protein
MEQKAPTWKSSLLEGLGATSLKIPGEDAGSKVKKFAAALSLAALAAMASFAPGVAHADIAPQGALELQSTVVTPDVPIPDDFQDSDLSEPVSRSIEIAVENPYNKSYTIAPREKGFIDKADDLINGGPVSQAEKEEAKRMKENNPIINSTAFKVFETVASPMTTAVDLVTDEGSMTNKVAHKMTDVASTAIQYAAVGPAVLIRDGVYGVKDAVGSLREHAEESHKKAQAAVDSDRERMSRVYVAERERIAAEESAKAQMSANRVDVSKAGSQGLETSSDGMDVLFKEAPAKTSSRDHDNTLSR